MYLQTNNHVYSLNDCIYAKCEGKSISFFFRNHQAGPVGTVTFNCRETAESVFDTVAKQLSNPYSTVIVNEFPVKGTVACDISVQDNMRRDLL